MNDPHVDKLYYRVRHGPYVDYGNAAPLRHTSPLFDVEIKDGLATFTLLQHFETEESSRKVIEPEIRAWEIATALAGRHDEFNLYFDRSEVVDRNPGGSAKTLHAEPGRYRVHFTDADLKVGKVAYPSPPKGFVVTTDVAIMFLRYVAYQEGKEPLPAMAYICREILEQAGGGSLAKASQKFGISDAVLRKI